MSNISQKKWMYLSFALMGIIASGILAPSAFGAALSHTDIFNALTGVDTKATAIKAKTDNLPSDPASQSAVGSTRSVSMGNAYDPADGGVIVFDVVPAQTGKMFHGFFDVFIDSPSGTGIRMFCDQTGGSGYDMISTANSANRYKIEFVCRSLDATILDLNDGTDAPGLTLSGNIQYTVSSDITNLP